jgi:hypothetical protein
MADTIPDIRISNTGYTDVYAATKIPKGTNLLIQNKTATGLYIQVRSTQPIASSRDGYLLMSNETCVVTSASISGVWIYGSGAVCVQVFE